MDNQTLVLLLAPLVLVDLGMRVMALLNWSKTRSTRGPRGLWLGVILLLNFGWVFWYLLGRNDEGGS
jgi:hypothetical protein